ncbi:MAG: hypothetical protein WD738_04595 [Pirellulales bacterium]
MTFYVALVAILNLALGYALAVFLRNTWEQIALSADDTLDEAASEEWETEPAEV